MCVCVCVCVCRSDYCLNLETVRINENEICWTTQSVWNQKHALGQICVMTAYHI